jgi:hypothetical protein
MSGSCLHGAIAVLIALLAAGWYEHNLGDGESLTLFCGVRVRVCSAGTPERLISSQRRRDRKNPKNSLLCALCVSAVN